jgi:preprotein translocase subunit SecA
VEGQNFEVRKHLIEYDDVMNRQREVIYTQRREVLGGEDIRDVWNAMIEEMVEDIVATFCPEKSPVQEWNLSSLADDFHNQFHFWPRLPGEDERTTQAELEQDLKQQVFKRLEEREEELTPKVLEYLMKVLLLQVIDSKWKDHLLSIDHLKEGIGLRGYGQKNPKQEYKREAFNLFMEVMGRIRQEAIQKLFVVQLVQERDVEQMEAEQKQRKVVTNRSDEPQKQQTVVRNEEKVGRNDPCPCGSGKKYKKCCGR